MKFLKSDGIIDYSDSVYPSELVVISEDYKTPSSWKRSTIFGYSIAKGSYTYCGQVFPILENSFFSLPILTSIESVHFQVKGKVSLFVRHGFIGQTLFLGLAEQVGRLAYVDGCSDSLLVFPPRLGDASLNLLYLPEKTLQTAHSHPTIRLGMVIDGHGVAQTQDADYPLSPGDAFSIAEHEIHRFKTTDSFLRVVAFHPDGDFGPTDNNHTMINRSYFKRGLFGQE